MLGNPPVTLADLRDHHAEIAAIAARNGVRTIRVFGSVARGDADAGSDVDFVVTFEPHRSLLDLSGLALDLEELLGCRVDVVTERSLHPRIRDRVLADAAPV
jgi:predicted nucleotidyltransferase